MAEEAIDGPAEAPLDEGGATSMRGVWVSAAALLTTLALIGLIAMIAWSNDSRDEALGFERRSYEVMLVTRTIDGTIARSEGTLGRYILDENPVTGTAYYNEWRLADFQLAQLRRLVRHDPDQLRRVGELRRLFDQRNGELGPAASAAERKLGTSAFGLLYQAAQSGTLTRLRGKLEEIADAERAIAARRAAETRVFVDRADTFTDWLSWLAVLIGIASAGLAFIAYRSFVDSVRAQREAESAGWRAHELDRAVQQRTRELSHANEALKAEAAERAAAEAQLRQVQKMEAVGQLTGGIAHDFNNMLAVVVGGLDLAKRRLAGPRREVEFHLDNAMEGATRAAALTRRLLAFARAEPLLTETVAPAERVEGMLELIDRSIGEGITIQTQFPSDNWPVLVDPTQLENALLNLAVNARDAMDGRGELTIAVDNVSLADGEIDDLPAGDFVRIAVSDTGAGISPENLERVFEPFFTTKPVGKGTGLGLTQIFGFARQSGGHATIQSVVGEGTKVTLFLPRFRGEAKVGAASSLQFQPNEGVASHPGARILVVEDDPRVSRATVSSLEELGYEPLPVPSGRDALDLLSAEADFDLVVTDVMMPEMTGTELAAAIRRLHPHIPVLFVTGYVGSAGDAEDLAGSEVLRKPFTVAGLARAVEAALGPPAPFTGSRLASTDEAAE